MAGLRPSSTSLSDAGHRAGEGITFALGFTGSATGSPRQCRQKGVNTWKGRPCLFATDCGSKSSALLKVATSMPPAFSPVSMILSRTTAAGS